MPTILNKALAAGQPAVQTQPVQPQQLDMGAGMDPVSVLMAEYKRLGQAHPEAPMFTPEQQTQRVNQNNDQISLGMIGAMSGDHTSGQVGGSVLKQALAARQPIHDQRGMMDPLTGDRAVDPAYAQQVNTQQRQHVLDKALMFEDQRQRSAERATQARERTNMMGMIADARWGANGRPPTGSGGAGHNMRLVTDQQTGEQFWMDPRNPQAPGVPAVNPNNKQPLVVPEKLAGSDNKELTDLATQKAALGVALQKVQLAPNAFGAIKGLPQQVPGFAGKGLQALRDRNLSPAEIDARAQVFNFLSAAIKERAGTAQSAIEMKRLDSFLPNDLDDAPRVSQKLAGFQQYLNEKEQAVKGRYAGGRPTQNLGGGQPGVPVSTPQAPAGGVAPAPGGASPGGSRFRVIGVSPGQ